MDKKNKLLIVGLVAIVVISIIITLPVVTSHYVGSHTWYAQPKCTGCHKDIVDEINSGDEVYLDYYPAPPREFHRATNNEACLLCHRTGNLTKVYEQVDPKGSCKNCHTGEWNGDPSRRCFGCHNADPYYSMHGHNVSVHECMDCHFNPSMWNHCQFHPTTFYPHELNGSIKMYYAVLWLKNGSAHQLMANQKGCLACHTGINVNITFTDMYTELVINFNSSSKDVKLSFGGSATSSWLVKGADKK